MQVKGDSGSTETDQPTILFFGARAEGHHSEYARHLAQYAAGRPELGHLHFVYPDSISQYGPAAVEAIRREPHCHLHELSRGEEKRIEAASLLRRSFVEWDVAAQYVRHIDADHCVLLELNVFQVALGLPRGKFNTDVTGILFFPYPRLEAEGNTLLDRLSCRVEKARKHLQLRWMLRNRNVNTVFLLNDRASAKYLNQFWPSRRPFSMLPDPVPSLGEKQEGEGAERSSVEGVVQDQSSTREAALREGGTERFVFLMFGALRTEKGVLEVGEAFKRLDSTIAKQATLCLFGKVRPDLEDEFPGLVASLRRAQPDLRLRIDDRFLPEEELHRALQEADVVLAPYLQAEGSSGVIGHAARYRTPVIGPNAGLVGALIERYDLGTRVDASRPDAIAEAVQDYVRGTRSLCGTAGMQTYVEERTPARFAETIFDAVLGEEH